MKKIVILLALLAAGTTSAMAQSTLADSLKKAKTLLEANKYRVIPKDAGKAKTGSRSGTHGKAKPVSPVWAPQPASANANNGNCNGFVFVSPVFNGNVYINSTVDSNGTKTSMARFPPPSFDQTIEEAPTPLEERARPQPHQRGIERSLSYQKIYEKYIGSVQKKPRVKYADYQPWEQVPKRKKRLSKFYVQNAVQLAEYLMTHDTTALSLSFPNLINIESGMGEVIIITWVGDQTETTSTTLRTAHGTFNGYWKADMLSGNAFNDVKRHSRLFLRK